MKPESKSMGFPHVLILFLFALSTTTSTASNSATFIKCLRQYSTDTTTPITSVLYSRKNSSFQSVYEFSIQNLLYNSTANLRPKFIITPLSEYHIQAAVICSRKHNLLIRVRSGGHDYEGLSFLSPRDFIIIDLVNFQKVSIDVENRSAWVQAGATVGQIYYHLAQQTSKLGFAAGVCTTMGAGGHISGGGLGYLWRKYGLASDNIIDAYLVDIKGRLLNRKSMGEDLFWAIRGGGGASFGVIVSWKIQLVPVPPVVTSFNIRRNLTQGATALFYKLQTSAAKVPPELHIRTIILVSEAAGPKTIEVVFQAQFLGNTQELLPIMKSHFPELGVQPKDCIETSWFQTVLTFGGVITFPTEVLLNRSVVFGKNYFKGKSDFVTKPITISQLESIWKWMMADPTGPMLVTQPMGGRMADIPQSASPYPHRAGNLYNIMYFQQWVFGNQSEAYVQSLRNFYNFMTPFVSSNPRTAYLNYRDLDLGVNKDVKTSYAEASVWGNKYFKDNFKRLACIKNKVDPKNFFWSEQSVPPYCSN